MVIRAGCSMAARRRRGPLLAPAASQSAYSSTLAFGTTEPTPILLHCGPIQVVVNQGQLDSITVGGVEVCRGISFMSRDAAWGTISQV